MDQGMLRRLSLLLVTLCLVPGLAWGQDEDRGFDIDGVKFLPIVDVQTKYDDNILSSETNTVNSIINLFGGGLTARAESGANIYNVQYNVQQGLYYGSHNDDFLDQRVAGDAHVEFSRRFAVDLRAHRMHMHDDRGTGLTEGASTTFANPDEWHATGGGGTVSYGGEGAKGRVIMAGDFDTKRYDNHRIITESRDLNTSIADGQFLWQLMPKTALLLHAIYTRFDYRITPAGVLNLDSNERRYLAGLTWEATAKTSGRIELGRLEKRFSDPGRQDFSGFSWEVGINWAPQTYSVFDVATSGRTDEITSGLGDFIDHKDVSGNWTHQWQERLRSVLSAYYARDKFTPSTRKDTLRNYSARLDYLWRPWLSIGVAYKRSERDSNQTGLNFKRNIYLLDLTAAL